MLNLGGRREEMSAENVGAIHMPRIEYLPLAS
jgi:hypothetical protein